MRRDHRHYAVLSDFLGDEDASLPKRQYAAAFRAVQRRILDGLGVEPVWIHTYREVTDKLRWLRGGPPEGGAQD